MAATFVDTIHVGIAGVLAVDIFFAHLADLASSVLCAATGAIHPAWLMPANPSGVDFNAP